MFTILNNQQTKWLVSKIKDINEKYINKVPLQEQDWKEFVDDVNAIYHTSKDNEDIKFCMMELIDCYDKIHTRIGGD